MCGRNQYLYQRQTGEVYLIHHYNNGKCAGSRLIVCPTCCVGLMDTDRARVKECPKCHELQYFKPSRQECRELAKAVSGIGEE